jgi:aspartate racemase
MKTLGLIGGMSFESTAIYYRLINEDVRVGLGGHHSAKLILWSVDFAEIEALQRVGDWDAAGAALAEAARRLEGAGAEAIVLATNTMHTVADAIAGAVRVPLLHIADATAAAVKRAGCRRPLLLATRYTMEQDFYRGRLAAQGVETMIPVEPDRTAVHEIIYGELVQGVVSEASRARYLDIVEAGRRAGADSVILGCTEVGMLIAQRDAAVPVFDTAVEHARAAVAFAVGSMKEIR